MNQPNIFNYATSELTQDAFITWLLNWANPLYSDENELLHNLGTTFLKSLLSLQDIRIEGIITDYSVQQQHHKIDVFVKFKVGDIKYGIIVEDKVHTADHNKQLERYLKIIKDSKTCDNIVPVYFKTGYQVNLSRIKDAGYHYYSIKDFLNLIREDEIAAINNDVLIQFYNYLLGKAIQYDDAESESIKYLSAPIKEWTWWTCVRFFHEYKDHFHAGWGEVANSREALLAFWFGGVDILITDNQGKELKLSLYVDIIYLRKTVKVCYRVSLHGNTQKDASVRDQIFQEFAPFLQQYGIESKRPKFSKAVKTMLLTHITNLDRSMGYDAFVKQLELYQNVLNEFVASRNKVILA